MSQSRREIRSADFILSAASRRQFVRDDRPQIAFVGRSNVGKSSLLNAILGRKGLAKVGSTPGRTRLVNYFLINGQYYFVDLPGYGFAKASKTARREWGKLVDDYLGFLAGPKLIAQLIDGKVGATKLDQQAREYFEATGLPCLTVATKIDKVPRSQRSKKLQNIRADLWLASDSELIPFSAKTREGSQQLWKGLTGFVELKGQPASLNQASTR